MANFACCRKRVLAESSHFFSSPLFLQRAVDQCGLAWTHPAQPSEHSLRPTIGSRDMRMLCTNRSKQTSRGRNLESRIVRGKISTGTHDTTWLLVSLQYAFVRPQMYRISRRLKMSNGPPKLC